MATRAEPDLDADKTLAERLGIAERVTFTGLVEPVRVARAADAGAMCWPFRIRHRRFPRDITSPLKLFEYMAAGRPIVASDLPSIREVLRDGVNALLVPPGDPVAMAAAIARLLGDRALAARLAARRAAKRCRTIRGSGAPNGWSDC